MTMTNVEAGIVLACSLISLFTTVFAVWWRCKH